MIGRNSFAKNAKKFSKQNSKFRLKIPYRYREILKKEINSLNYDVNAHVYFKSNSVQLHM